MMTGTSELPDSFTVRTSGWLRTFESRIQRTNGGWIIETTVSWPIIGTTTVALKRPVDEVQVRHVYEEYDVVDTSS